MLFQTLFNRIYYSIELLCYIGVDKQPVEDKKKFVMLSNLISISNFSLLTLNGFLFLLFTVNTIGALASFLSALLLLLAVYFNSKGWHHFTRVYMVVAANSLCLAGCIVFSHESFLDYYFIAIVTASYFLFHYKDKKWLYLSAALSLSYLVIETTGLQNYLPAFNLMRDEEVTNLILLFGFIIMLTIQSAIYIYISTQTELDLLKKQKLLIEIQNQLQVQNEDLETFSMAASHSLQTPIYIAGFFLLKIKNSYPEMAAKNTKDFGMVENSLAQMDLLVSGLFSYNKIIKIEKDTQRVDASGELVKIKKILEKKFTPGIIILPAEPIAIISNQLLFSVIIQNLIENGMIYNNSPVPEVTVEYAKKNGLHVFSFSDNGIGIDPAHFLSIFQPFKRINIQGRYKGTGLGLSGAKRAAERINGNLYCDASSPQGSRFVLELPANF